MNDDLRPLAFSEYPITLQNMKSPPKTLQMRGQWASSYSKDPDHHRFLCVIGSRIHSTYGAQAVKKLMAGLRGYPISIVSGLAIGIDSLAHEAALEADLHCIGFPGSGLGWDVLYPPSRVQLARRIVEAGGALMSEWPSSFPFTNWTFAARNRIMAGLSHATLIIEAKQGSGTLKTAEYAEKNDRDLLVVPGSIFSELSYGPHMLYKRGAIPIFESADILEALGFTPAPKGAVSEEKFASLDPLSRQIISFIKRYGEASNEGLSEELNLPASQLSMKLSDMELEGIIEIRGSVMYLA